MNRIGMLFSISMSLFFNIISVLIEQIWSEFKGTRLSKKENFTRGTRYSVLAALSVDGIEAAHTIIGAYKREMFECVMLQFVFPKVGSCGMKRNVPLLSWITVVYTILKEFFMP